MGASGAFAQQAIIYCSGYSVTRDGTTGDVGSIGNWKYYRFGEGVFQVWEYLDPFWTSNQCELQKARCELTENTFTYYSSLPDHSNNGDLTHSVTINRKTGEVSDGTLGSDGGQVFFRGSCYAAADPQPTGPNKF